MSAISRGDAPAFDLESVHRVLPVDWPPAMQRQLVADLGPYLLWIQRFMDSGAPLPSHIENSGCVAVPIGETMTPQEMFSVLGGEIEYEVREYDEFWVTTHYPNPEPVVTLLPKILPGSPACLELLSERCGEALGCTVGGPDGMFLAYLLPGFSWAMHTDHENDYELIASRVHVPLTTNPESVFVWGRHGPDGEEEWLVEKHLDAGRVHFVRVDVPHTVVNRHASKPRLHLILDVHEDPAGVRYRSVS